MNTQLETFAFQSHALRILPDEHGAPWFIAKDVCDILELPNVSMAIGRLDDDEKLTSTLLMSGQNREVFLINEPGLYSLILTSRKPEAKAFKKWLTSEVLPSIRKHGAYISENSEFAELQALLNSSYTNPLSLAEVEKLHANILNRVDKLIKQVPLHCTLADLEQSRLKPKRKPAQRVQQPQQPQTAIPGFEAAPSDLSALSMAERHEVLLARYLEKLHKQGSTLESIKVLRSRYRKQFKATGKINPTLEGVETRGRPCELSDEIINRFLEMLTAAADQTNALTYLPVTSRKMTHFCYRLKCEFNQDIHVEQLWQLVKSKGLQAYFKVGV